MSSGPHELDRLINEVLKDLTAGAPREGFRGRVMARITTSPEPSRVRFVEISGWRVQPARLAAVAALAACMLVAALVVPSMLRTTAPSPAQTATAGNPPVAEPKAAAPAAPQSVAVELQAADTSAQPRLRRATVRRTACTTATPAAADESGAAQWVTVDPLPEPDPIAHRGIEIRPVEIQPLVIPEIQVPALEAGGTVRSPGPAK